nr:zinc finger, CCHC-type [Tanacetum cinerariifolium]
KVFTRLSDFCDHKFITKIEVSVIMTNEESVKDMTSKFDKLNETLKTTRKRMKWENDDYICCGHILNGMSDFLFDIYQNVESAKALWESLESKYMAEDASATKFFMSNLMNYKMVDTRPVMEQYHEMVRILRQYTQHNLMMDEAISVAVIVDKLPASWKEFKHGLKHKKEDMVERDEAQNSNNNKNKRKLKSGDDKFATKKGTITCWKCKRLVIRRRIVALVRAMMALVQMGLRILKSNKDDEVAWLDDSGATSHACKDLRWFQVCKSIEDGSFVKWETFQPNQSKKYDVFY